MEELRITLAEWLEQQAYVAMCQIQPAASSDVVKRIERLEQIVFASAQAH